MAEGSLDSFVTPEKIEISSGKSGAPSSGYGIYPFHRRASIGSYRARDRSRRNLLEKSESANNSLTSNPGYLRASTGSCHDFCKYGRKHALEAKEKHILLKEIVKSSSNEPNSVETAVPREQNKGTVVKNKASCDTKSQIPKHKPSLGTKSYSPKPKSSLDTKIYSPEQNALSGTKAYMPRHKASSTKHTPSPYPPEIIKREILLPSKKVVNKMPGNEKKPNNVSNKDSSPVHSKNVITRPSSTSYTADDIQGKDGRNREVKTGQKFLVSKASARKALSPPPASLSPQISRKVSLKARKASCSEVTSLLKDGNRMRKAEANRTSNEKIPEKTLHVIKTESKNDSLESVQDRHFIQPLPSPSSLESLSLSKPPTLLSREEEEEEEEETDYDESEVDEMIFDDNDTAEVVKVKSVMVDHNKIPRKSKAVGSEDDATIMLKFRRGKVVELKSDNNGPRRLQFRRGRVLMEDEDIKGNSGRKTHKNVINDDKGGAELSSEKVMLKHQDVLEKKDEQGLLNNVIEETASKLVETRKSKVKALVGAFESVISLHESKPPSHGSVFEL